MQTFIFWVWVGDKREFVTLKAKDESAARGMAQEMCQKNGWRLVVA